MHEFFVGFVGFPLGSFGVLGDEYVFDEFIQLVQVEIGKDRTHNGPLGSATVGLIPSPIFEVSCFEQAANEAEKPFIFDGFSQDGEQQFMRKRIKALRDIAFYEPDTSHPGMIDLPQCRMTPPVWSKPMRMGAKLRFQVSIQKQTNYLLYQFI